MLFRHMPSCIKILFVFFSVKVIVSNGKLRRVHVQHMGSLHLRWRNYYGWWKPNAIGNIVFSNYLHYRKFLPLQSKLYIVGNMVACNPATNHHIQYITSSQPNECLLLVYFLLIRFRIKEVIKHAHYILYFIFKYILLN